MTQRLAAIALDRWEDLDGYAAGQGLDLESLPQDRFDNFVWWFVTHDATDPREVEKFRTRLWRPPPGQAVTDARSPWSPQAETSAFGSLKAALTGTPTRPTPESATTRSPGPPTPPAGAR